MESAYPSNDNSEVKRYHKLEGANHPVARLSQSGLSAKARVEEEHELQGMAQGRETVFGAPTSY